MTEQSRYYRYEEYFGITSCLNPMDDMVTLVESLGSLDYLRDVMAERHSLKSKSDAKRAQAVVHHVGVALDYIDQALAGSRDVSFLPVYYSMLNLAKVYVLLGPLHVDLPTQRWHGVKHDVGGRDSRTLMTERVTIKPKGAIPLLYATLTGKPVGRTDVELKLRDFYGYIGDIGAEFSLVTGEHSSLCEFLIDDADSVTQATPHVLLMPLPGRHRVSLNEAKVLKGTWSRCEPEPYRFPGVRIATGSAMYKGQSVSTTRNVDPVRRIRAQLNTHLLHHPREDIVYTPCSRRRLEFPEELPIILLFYHMSSVVRYKPEFLARVRDSRYWPLLLAARRHCLLKFLLLFWSFVHQKTLIIRHA